MSYTPTSFGDWLRYRRKLLDLTQRGLAQQVSCAAATIRKIEAEERKPSRQLAELLARALEISPAEKEAFLQMARGRLPEASPVVGAVKASAAVPHNLPAPLTSMIDRRRDLAAMSSLLADPAVRLVTLVGPPGIGKTRLSIQCGQKVLPAFPDGVWFVDLSGVREAAFLLPVIARALEACDLPPCPALPQLISHLKARNLLLILDNFEQLAEPAALEVARLLQGAPGLKVLVTSRVPLHLYGEYEYRLPPLSVPSPEADDQPGQLMQYEAVQLFVARVRQHQPDFAVTAQNSAGVVRVCAVLDGIPLALELAAVTLQRMTLDEMAALLQAEAGRGWVRQLATPARDLPLRQRTLENVIAWSYSLLETGQQEFFCRLGILDGWFDAGAAEAVSPDTETLLVHPILEHLADHNLLVCGRFDATPHWRMLELIHEFAAFQLAPEERAVLEARRARFCLQRLQAAVSPGMEALFRTQADNFHAALRWAIAAQESQLAYQLALGLLNLWEAAGYLREGLALAQQVIHLPGEISPALRVEVISKCADLAWHQHDFDTALRYAEMTVQQARQEGLIAVYPEHCNRLGRIYLEQGRYVEAAEALQESLALQPESGWTLAQLGELAWFEGRLDAAQEILRQALAHLEETEPIFRTMALTDLAEVALARGDYAGCRLWLRQASQPMAVNLRRVLVFLLALAGYLLNDPASRKAHFQHAARLLGARISLSERSGVTLSAFYRRLEGQRRDLLRRRLSAAEVQAAIETGEQWDKDQAVSTARDILSGETSPRG